MRRRASACAFALCCAIALPRTAVAAESIEDARALLAAGDRDEARIVLARLAESGSSDGDVYLYLGALERESQRIVRAIAVFEAGVAVAPEHVDLQAELAMTYAWNGRFDDALVVYDRVLAQDPSNTTLKLNRARVLAWAGRHKEAVAVYDAALQADPNDIEALRGMAFVHRSRMRNRRAREYYGRVLALDPKDSEARDGLRGIDDATRWEIRVGSGLVHFPGTTAVRTEAAVAVQATPELGLRGAYSSDIPTGVGATTGDPQTAVTHVPEFGVTYRVRPRVTVGGAYQSRLQMANVTHRLALRASVNATETLVALVGARPGVRHDGRTEVLGDVGLQWTPLTRLWIMAQGFYFTNTLQATSWTAVGTVWLQAARVLSFRGGGGGGQIGTRGVGLLFASTTVSIAKRLGISVSYEYPA